MIGNLKMYLGRRGRSTTTASSSASCSCRSLPRTVALWLLRFGLIGALVLHLHAAYTPDDAQPPGPAGEVPVAARLHRPPTSPAARCAGRASSSLLFLVWHLADLTWGWVNPGLRPRRRSYRNVDAQPRRGARSRSSTSSPTSPSASTCSTARGACSSRWAGTTRGSTRGAATSPPRIATIIVVGNVLVPHRRPRRHRRDLTGARHR